VTPGMRSRTDQGYNVATDGAPKNSGTAPVMAGMTRDRSKPTC
jgi:hypothetical protein